jgi:hypothetical protein
MKQASFGQVAIWVAFAFCAMPPAFAQGGSVQKPIHVQILPSPLSYQQNLCFLR